MADTALAYGTSGCGKTTLCEFLSRWMYQTYGLTTRLISADLGGWGPVEKAGLIKAGIVSAFNVASRPNVLSDWRKLGRGEWPKILTEKGKKIRRIVSDPQELAKVGLYFIESTNEISDGFMRYIPTKSEVSYRKDGSEQVRDIGPQGATGRYEEEGEIFAGNSEGHYHMVQTEMHELFSRFSNLGGSVKLVFWTSQVGSGKMKGEPVFCPLLVGEAKNASVVSWVGDCFHIEMIPVSSNDEGQVQRSEVRAYFAPHPERDTGKVYLCKPRTSSDGIDALWEKFPEGYIPLTTSKNIEQYFEWQRTRGEKSYEEVMKWKGEIDAKRNNRG